MLLNIFKTTTHLDHIAHPFTRDKGMDEPSLTKRVAGVVVFIFLSLLTLGAASAFYLYQASWKWHKDDVQPHLSAASTKPSIDLEINESDKPSLKLIQQFWKEHIQSFKISHGTSALYLQHFKEHGLSATYPKALETIIQKIRTLWNNHEHDIMPKTGYFRWFEQRYDEARQKLKVTFSFSCKPSITDEFTTGARQGGEWIREVRSFLRETRSKTYVFSTEEKQTLLETEALVYVIDTLPALIVKINAGCPDLAKNHGFWNRSEILCSSRAFINLVKKDCPDWQTPAKLQTYLNGDLLSRVTAIKKGLEESYELSVTTSVQAEHLEFEFVGGHKRKAVPTDYPKLEFDRTTTLSCDEIIKLQINDIGFTDIEEYQNSRFESMYLGKLKYSITRRMRTAEDAAALALSQQKQNLRKSWLRAFGCEEMMSEYAI